MIEVGTQFYQRGKRKDICTVIDILKTINLKGEVVRTEYLYEKDFLGQKLKGTCPAPTITLNLINRS